MTLWVLRMIEERHHRDVEGRPIHEGRTPAEHLREGDIEYKPCPYPGSRFGHAHPMNVSALRQTGAHWDEICDALAFLRAGHDEFCTRREPVMDIWRTSQLGSALPWFFLFRDGAIPAYAAALAKATLGMGIWAHRLVVRVLEERWTPPSLTPGTMVALAEATGILIGPSEVCAADDKMLKQLCDVLVTQRPGKLDAPREDVLRFGAHHASFKLLVYIYYLARRFLYADAGHSPDSDVEPSDLFVIEPDLAPGPAARVAWFITLAELVVPFAPGGSDVPLAELAREVPAIMAGATFAALDAWFERVVRQVETGLRGEPFTGEITVEMRDRMIGGTPRAVLS